MGKHTAARGDRPERDLPILLLPNASLGLTGSDRKRAEEDLPYLLGTQHRTEFVAPAADVAVTAPWPAVRLPRNEGALLRLGAEPHGGRA